MAANDSFHGSLCLSNLSSNSSEEEVKDIYNKWAHNYDKDAAFYGYISHKACADIFDAEMKKLFEEGRLNKRILDAGAGTGIIGQNLKDLGYTNVDALDISQEILNISRDKKVYKNLICAPISEKRIDQIETGCYDALICSGTITIGHVKAAALHEVVRLVKPGGVVCFSIRVDVHDSPNYAYKEKIDEIVALNKWTFIMKEATTYHTNVGDRVELENCYILVYRIN